MPPKTYGKVAAKSGKNSGFPVMSGKATKKKDERNEVFHTAKKFYLAATKSGKGDKNSVFLTAAKSTKKGDKRNAAFRIAAEAYSKANKKKFCPERNSGLYQTLKVMFA